MSICKILLFSIMFISLNSFAAFNEIESLQLKKINKDSNNEIAKIKCETKKILNEVVELYPERSEKLKILYIKWYDYISNKCEFDSFESLGTDAEISTINDCKINEFNTLNKYLNGILSMP